MGALPPRRVRMTGLPFPPDDPTEAPNVALADAGNTVVVIEHNLDVIKTADWVIDLGPEGGDAGGELVAAGTPEQVASVPDSFTGQYLRHALGMPDVEADAPAPVSRSRRRQPAAVAG